MKELLYYNYSTKKTEANMNFKKINIKQGQKILDLLDKKEQKKYFCAKVDGIVKSLNYTFKENGKHNIEFLDLKNQEACKIYEASLRYLATLAIKMALSEKTDVRYYYYVSRSIYGKLISKNQINFSRGIIEKIKNKMDEFISEDIKFTRVKFTKKEALDIYKKQQNLDKIQVLKYRKENYVHLYKTVCLGRSEPYYDYLYEELVPSAGYLKDYEIYPYGPGFILSTPRSDFNGKIPDFVDETKFAEALSSNSKFAEQNCIDTAVGINNFLKKNEDVGLISISESRINRQLVEVTNEIINSPKEIKLVCIAGPSSSGKTSFANRLMYELMSLGKKTMRISIDNFYIPKDKMKPGTDIESLEAIDVELFNETLLKMIFGYETSLPTYDFKTNLRKFGPTFTTDGDQIIIIEGIHALNSNLTSSIPEYSKYKIYISPQPQVNIDNHTPLSMSNLRLLRRIARDSRTRGTAAKETINMWSNVRNGEFLYIYPTQENADYVFDSFYFYEPCALRNVVLPLLDEISSDDKEYTLASELKQVVKYFLPMEDKFVPCNSLMREFIGGTCFKDAK